MSTFGSVFSDHLADSRRKKCLVMAFTYAVRAITKSITLTSGEADKLEAVAGEADKKSEAEMYAHERCPLVGVCGSAGGRLLAGAMGFPHL